MTPPSAFGTFPRLRWKGGIKKTKSDTNPKSELYKYITGIIQNNKHKLIAINGMPDHAHIFIGYKPHQLIPDLIQDVKGCSSKWINAKGFIRGKFNWQEGYGAFSYSH